MNDLPFKVYMNAPQPDGFLLYNDRAFVTQLYGWNSDEFTDLAKVQDLSEQMKGNIYAFLEESNHSVMLVDCENSDAFNVIAMLRNLDWDYLQKLSKIILINDVNASLGWGEIGRYTDIEIEHIMTSRIKNNKSLVDGTLISKAFLEHYKNDVDSFILLLSDSDYWALISMLTDAKFLVMVEHEKCGPDLRSALASEGVFFCFLDDFFSDETTTKMKKDLLATMVSSSGNNSNKPASLVISRVGGFLIVVRVSFWWLLCKQG